MESATFGQKQLNELNLNLNKKNYFNKTVLTLDIPKNTEKRNYYIFRLNFSNNQQFLDLFNLHYF